MICLSGWQRRLFSVLLFTALLSGFAAKAQAQEVPAKIRGNWALPDCKTYDEALIITRHFYLKSDKDGSTLWPLTSGAKRKDYWVMPIEGEKRPLQITADGVLKIGLLDGEPPKKWPKKWSSLQIDDHSEYMGCVEIPAILPDPLVRAMAHIDEVEKACHSSLSDSCKQLLFSIADENKDKKISIREMKTAASMLASLALLAKDHTASRYALDKAVYQSLQEADRIAGRLMPEDREMSYKNFSDFLAKADSPLLHEALEDIGRIIPGFKD